MVLNLLLSFNGNTAVDSLNEKALDAIAYSVYHGIEKAWNSFTGGDNEDGNNVVNSFVIGKPNLLILIDFLFEYMFLSGSWFEKVDCHGLDFFLTYFVQSKLREFPVLLIRNLLME